MSSIRSMSRLCLMGMRSTPKLTSSSTVQLSRAMPMVHNKISIRTMATSNVPSSKADSDLVEFLTEEISAEKSNHKAFVEIPGFVSKKEGAELTFTKNHGNEKIVVTLNVNHTVDSAEPDDGSEEAPEMKSMPNFEVDIAKSDGRTLSFSCSYLNPDEEVPSSQEEQFDDAFSIDEVTMFDGEEWSEKKYAVAGDILDGNLYDLFMGMLDERGINKQFADRLSDYCSGYEHGLYIKMLQDLQKFAK